MNEDIDEKNLGRLANKHYGANGEGRGGPVEMPTKERFYPIIFELAQKHLSEHYSGDTSLASREIFQRVQNWPAFQTFTALPWDKRWDVRDVLPQSDAVNSDQALGSTSIDLSEMIRSRAILAEYQGDDEKTETIVNHLQRRSIEGITTDGAMAKVMIPIHGIYGVELHDRNLEKVIDFAITGNDQRRIKPVGEFTANDLFEEFYLRGKSNPTKEQLAHHFEGISQTLQFRTAREILDVTASLSQVSPDLHKKMLGFYKQYKSMIFGRTLQKTHQSIEKLQTILADSYDPGDESSATHALRAADTVLLHRVLFDSTLMEWESKIADLIEAGYYEDLSTHIQAVNER